VCGYALIKLKLWGENRMLGNVQEFQGLVASMQHHFDSCTDAHTVDTIHTAPHSAIPNT